jgi:hypothetical protein
MVLGHERDDLVTLIAPSKRGMWHRRRRSNKNAGRKKTV